MKNNKESSVLEYAISALTEDDYAQLVKQAEEESLDLFSSEIDSTQFDVKNFEIISVSKSPEGFVVMYKGAHLPKGSQDFDKASIVQKGYEPVDIQHKNQEITVHFNKTDWHLKN